MSSIYLKIVNPLSFKSYAPDKFQSGKITNDYNFKKGKAELMFCCTVLLLNDKVQSAKSKPRVISPKVGKTEQHFLCTVLLLKEIDLRTKPERLPARPTDHKLTPVYPLKLCLSEVY